MKNSNDKIELEIVKLERVPIESNYKEILIADFWIFASKKLISFFDS